MTETITPNAEVAPIGETPAPSWFIDEGMPGLGERPSWLPEKYKTVADLAKSNAELEKKLGTAPEEYDISGSKFLDPDYVPFQEFMQFAKEKRVPKEVMDKMVDSIDKYMDEFSINPEEEFKKLGENSQERMKTLDNWAKATLTDDAYKALTGSLKTADAIKALEQLRGKVMSNNTQVPPGNDNAGSNVATLDDIRTELNTNLAKYKSDPVYRKDIQARLETASKSSNYVDKMGA